ncbi:methyl-accepting chemotaxis protein [Dactylosporangium sp. AC04546]|uniref:methyl-accepting chemotaxis protein n=1 Tax=Dactylosporangium sp. AC04546 TaxID=2862460 RepID=UPI001EE09CE1|nr:methyl-accepting chemotaxis protein [Dactylosporangium sp. AC04546]WVK82688.1 methyl-accepting chemotaxis protein [Dactylosporangium sp. AC04546]
MSWFANRSVRAKVISAVAVGAVVTVLITIAALNTLSKANDTMRQFTAKNGQFVALADMRQGISDILGALNTDQQKAADVSLAEAIQRYRAGAGADRGADLTAVEQGADGYRKVRDTEANAAIAKGDVAGYVTVMSTKGQPQLQKAIDAIGHLQDQDIAEAEHWRATAENDYENSRMLMILAAVIGLLAAFGIGLWVTALVVGPLRRVAEVLRAVAGGDLSTTVAVRSTDEVGVMAEALNKATDSMRTTVHTMDQTASSLATSANQLTGISAQIASGTGEASDQANVVAAAAEEVSRNVQTVAAGADEMGVSIREIAQNASEAAKVASQAVMAAESTNQAVSRLGESSTEIGNVVKVITSIAEQTNLLALNATIEAARAGEAGKGFAVVANEVKELAQETARATEDISRRVEAIQADTTGAVGAIGEISQIISRINDYQLTIASAVEQQTATTNEMNRSVSEAATGSAEIATNVSTVAAATQGTSRSVTEAQRAASDLSRMSSEMRSLVARFKI